MVTVEIYRPEYQPIMPEVVKVNWYPWINAQNALELAYNHITWLAVL